MFLGSIQGIPVTGIETIVQNLPELFRVLNKKSLKLQSLGETIGYFCKQYLVSIAKFAYTLAVNGMTIDAVITKLGIVA